MRESEGRVKPYYQSPDGAIVVYNARWEDALAAGLIPVREVALVHADPPYGQNERTARGKAGRGTSGKSGSRFRRLWTARDFPPVIGDDTPFDPAPLIALDCPLVTWGAQRYADKLPSSPSWIWWGKRDGTTPDDNGDGELAWTNLGGPPREFQHMWRGTCRASEVGVAHLAPTQKPEALSAFVFAHAVSRKVPLVPGALLFVPYLGSGPDLRPALAMGLRVIACDVSEEACRVAVGARLHAAPVIESPGPLFAGLKP